MRQAIVALILVASIGAAPAAPEKGWFGFKLAVKTSGFALNPTVVVAVVQSVEPNSPASEQNIAAGDEIVDVEGKTVAGNKARELNLSWQRVPEQSCICTSNVRMAKYIQRL